MRTPFVTPLPELIRQLPANQPLTSNQDVGYTVINYNTAAQTLRCIASLTLCTPPPAWIYVLDNASADADLTALVKGIEAAEFSEIQLFCSQINLGFAAGSNFLIHQLMEIANCHYIGLLNNDAVARPELIHLLRAALSATDTCNPIGMSGGRMHKLNNPDEVDTLGITLYASLMPADRKDTQDPYLGPTGGCCLMNRDFVQDITSTTGYCFDERFFCYCEDTDLALRANLLGYRPAYVDQLVALHEGQASSSAQHSSFIAYHGLRNLLWMHWKLMPTSLFLKNSPWLLMAHVLNVIKQLLFGRPGVLFALYCDALKKLPVMLDERSQFKFSVRVSPLVLAKIISSRFYRQGYAESVLCDWWKNLRK